MGVKIQKKSIYATYGKHEGALAPLVIKLTKNAGIMCYDYKTYTKQ